MILWKRYYLFLLILFNIFLSGNCFAETLQTGETLFIGKYEQDNDLTNGPEPIEWQVLAVEDDIALLTSKYVLEVMPFNDSMDDVYWKTCSLRSWLNGEFYDTAFTESEKAGIAEAELENPDTSMSAMLTGKARDDEITNDKIFVLNQNEALQLIADNAARKAEGTAYETANDPHAEGGFSPWWLRSRGDSSSYFAFVGNDGVVYSHGSKMIHPYGVRPAMLWSLRGE